MDKLDKNEKVVYFLCREFISIFLNNLYIYFRVSKISFFYYIKMCDGKNRKDFCID